MKFYLSSYKLGKEINLLKQLISQSSGVFGYIPNALDFSYADVQRRKAHVESDMQDLRQVGATVELLDLKEYFGKEAELKKKLQNLGGVYISGGNSFVLRQAMKLSGFDAILLSKRLKENFVYIAYSAGVCVLAPTMNQYAITDDAKDFPYAQIKEQVWEGLGILDFVFEPHYDSDHPESASTDKEIKYLIDNKIAFKAYRDGEVLIVE